VVPPGRPAAIWFPFRQRGDVVVRHRLQRGPGLFLFAVAVIGRRARPREDVQIESGKAMLVEPQRRRSIRQCPIEIGAGPVDDRHEVVADDMDASGGDGLKAGDPRLDRPAGATAEPLDVVGDRDAFDDAPGQRAAAGGRGVDQRFACGDIGAGPGFAGRDVMQRMDHIAGAGLPDVVEADRIVGSKPPPRLPHRHSPPR